VLQENERLRKALAFIGRKGERLSGYLACRVARVALDRTSDEAPEQVVEREIKNGNTGERHNRKRRKSMWHEGRTTK
jgi:hypothetical protein